MLRQFGALGVTMSWDDGLLGARASRPHDDGFLGARASRPHQAWHSLGHLLHLDQPGTAPWLYFGLAATVPAHGVAACSIALKLSGGQRDWMRAGRPRSQAMPSRRCRGGCLAGDFSEKGRPVGDVSSADLPRPRLRRSPENHNTAGRQDYSNDNPPGPSPGVPVSPRMRRSHLAVGVSPWKGMFQFPEPRRRRQQVAPERQPSPAFN